MSFDKLSLSMSVKNNRLVDATLHTMTLPLENVEKYLEFGDHPAPMGPVTQSWKTVHDSHLQHSRL